MFKMFEISSFMGGARAGGAIFIYCRYTRAPPQKTRNLEHLEHLEHFEQAFRYAYLAYLKYEAASPR